MSDTLMSKPDRERLRALVQAHAAHGALAVQTDWTQTQEER